MWNYCKLAIALLGLTGVLLTLWLIAESGVGLSPDSVNYIALSRSISDSFRFASFDDKPMVVFPPLYPALLASSGFLSGADPLSCAGTVNAFIFGLTVYFAGLLFLRYLPQTPCLAAVATLTIVVSVPLLKISTMAWTEPLFILFVVVALLQANSYQRRARISLVFTMAACAALASLTRYIGIALIPVGALTIFLFSSRNPTRSRVEHMLLYLVVSGAPLGIWVSRNYVLSGTFFGNRPSSMTTLSQNLILTLHTLPTWYVPKTLYEHRSILAFAGLTAGFLLGLVAPKIDWRRAKEFTLEITPVVLFIVFYLSLVLYSASTVAIDSIGWRLLSPLYIPLNLLIIGSIVRLFKPAMGYVSPRTAGALLMVGIVAWSAFSARKAMVSLDFGYHSQDWRDNETIRYAKQKLDSGEKAVESNAPDGLYIHTGIKARTSPRNVTYNSTDIRGMRLSDLQGTWPEDKACYLVWFENVNRRYLYTVEELREIAHIQEEVQFLDGTVYFVTRK